MNASEIQTRCKNRPILDVEILRAHGTGLIDTAAKLSVTGYTLYKILAERGQQFRETKMRIGLTDGTCKEERILLTETDVRVSGWSIRHIRRNAKRKGQFHIIRHEFHRRCKFSSEHP